MNLEVLNPLFDAIEVDEGVMSYLESLGQEGRSNLIAAANTIDGSVSDIQRSRAIYALGELGWRPAFRSLVKLINDEAATVRLSAMHTLTKIGGGNAVEPLLCLITEENISVTEKAHALDCLARVGDTNALEEIRRWAACADSVDLQSVARAAIDDISFQLDTIAATLPFSAIEDCNEGSIE